MKRTALLPLALLVLLAQCRQHETPAPDPASLLPPATQTGARTFGCLVNGRAWMPDRDYPTVSNYVVSYDPTYAGGNLLIKARYYPSGAKEFQGIDLGVAKANRVGVYSAYDAVVNPTGTAGGTYVDYNLSQPCNEYIGLNGRRQKGQLTITRLDLVAGVVSGTFAFTLWQPGCDTMHITQGRFDYKL